MATFEPNNVQLYPRTTVGTDVSAPSAHTAAVLTYAALGTGVAHVISGLTWSYVGSGTLTGGNIKIAEGGVTLFSVDVSAQGVGQLNFSPPKVFTPNTELVITLADGGANVTGKLNATDHYTRTGVTYYPAVNFNQPRNSMLIPALFH